MFERYKAIHFTGIGGIGMSGIAEVLYNLGYDVRGSDMKGSQTTERLSGLGIKVHIGHEAANVEGAHVVVISSAVKADNPEVLEAKRLGIPVIPRAEMLAELGRLKYALLVAGSHGKTTTTSVLSTILAHAGFDPTVVIGGKLKALGTNARLGRGEFMVAEADESDGSFLKLNPTIGVVTNIDSEHMDHFGTMDTLREAFLTFINSVPFYGAAVCCIDDPNVRGVLANVHRKVITYGFSEDAEMRADDVATGGMTIGFDVIRRGERLGRISAPMLGRHNVLNCLASIAVALELQVPIEKIREAIDGFQGIGRRLEPKGQGRGVRVYDDYGHHPTEISATLSAVRDSMSEGRLIVVFQPHRYTRTRALLKEFAGCFAGADLLVMMDIYAAGEKPIEGISSASIIDAMSDSSRVRHLPGHEDAVSFLMSEVREGDIVLTLGAGDVYKVGEEVASRLENRDA